MTSLSILLPARTPGRRTPRARGAVRHPDASNG